jgi:hypothetical protein
MLFWVFAHALLHKQIKEIDQIQKLFAVKETK